MKDYIDIKPDFTLDKDLDNSAPTGKENVFTDMKNYIPEQGSIITRRGISGFDFTNEVFSPLQDPNLLMWLRMETNPTLDDCEIQGADYMINSGPVSADNTTYWEGSGSAFLDHVGDTQRLYKATTDLPVGFPAKDNEDGYMFTFFFELDWFPTAVDASVMLYKDGTPGGSDMYGSTIFGATRDITDSYPCPYFIPYDANGASTFFRGDANLWGGAYHCGIWVSKSLQLAGIRTYSVTTGEVLNSTTPCNGTSIDNSSGKYFYVAHTRYRGWIDDLMVFDKAPATEGLIYSKIDSIRKRSV